MGRKNCCSLVKKYVSICNSVDGKSVSLLCTIQIIVVLNFTVFCLSKWTLFRTIKNHVLSLPDFFIIKLAKICYKKDLGYQICKYLDCFKAAILVKWPKGLDS